MTGDDEMGSFFRIEGKRLVRECRNEILWIEPWGADSLRVRGTKRAAMELKDWALLPQQVGDTAKITISDDGLTAEVKNGRITARVSAGGKISFFNADGKLLLEEFVRSRDNLKEFVSALCIDAREYSPIPGTNDFRLTVRFEPDDDEKIFGMGQYQQPYLDLKGCTLELAHTRLSGR